MVDGEVMIYGCVTMRKAGRDPRIGLKAAEQDCRGFVVDDVVQFYTIEVSISSDGNKARSN